MGLKQTFSCVQTITWVKSECISYRFYLHTTKGRLGLTFGVVSRASKNKWPQKSHRLQGNKCIPQRIALIGFNWNQLGIRAKKWPLFLCHISNHIENSKLFQIWMVILSRLFSVWPLWLYQAVPCRKFFFTVYSVNCSS